MTISKVTSLTDEVVWHANDEEKSVLHHKKKIHQHNICSIVFFTKPPNVIAANISRLYDTYFQHLSPTHLTVWHWKMDTRLAIGIPNSTHKTYSLNTSYTVPLLAHLDIDTAEHKPSYLIRNICSNGVSNEWDTRLFYYTGFCSYNTLHYVPL